MIKKLNNTKPEVAQEMMEVFRASYAVEAKLLQATDFPPLKRPLEGYMNATTQFYGFYKDQNIAGIIEITVAENTLHINSLVVHPDFFRQGIARQLLDNLFANYYSPIYTVETGADNIPASNLYRSYNFTEINQYDTDHGVRKVRFEKLNLSTH